MPPGDEDVLRGDYLRALEMVRKERDELGGARDLHPADRAFEEGRITLREHALLAYLEMLDRDQYWVFATAEEQAAAEATLTKDVYTVTGGVGSSVERFLVLPLLRDRFPLYYRAAEDARVHLASVLDPLVREFNALPEEERRLIHRMRFQPSEWAGLSAATVELLRRYAARSIVISKETFVARAKSLG